MLKFIHVKNLTELGYNRFGSLDRNWFCLSVLIKKESHLRNSENPKGWEVFFKVIFVRLLSGGQRLFLVAYFVLF